MDTVSMAERWNKERILKNNYAFRILKKISSMEGGSYATEINKIIEKNDREEVSRVINKFEEIGLVQKGERNRAQYYELRSEGLTQLFCEIWGFQNASEEVNILLERYLSNYENPEGTIDSLLRRDFAYAVKKILKDRDLENLEELIEYFKVIERQEDYKPPSIALTDAIKSIDRQNQVNHN